MSQRGRAVGLADPDRAEDEPAVTGRGEPQGGQVGEEFPVVGEVVEFPQVSSRIAGSSPAAQARSIAERDSRRMISSLRTSSRNRCGSSSAAGPGPAAREGCGSFGRV